MTMHRFVLAVLALAGFLGTASAQSPLTSLEVFPPDVNLETARDKQSFIVQAWFADGLSRDVTAEAKVVLTNPAFAKLEGNVVHPVADGATEMLVEWGGKSVKLPVKVKDAKADRPISFKLDIMPIFMRSGCNTGSCHGAARGKDGFRRWRPLSPHSGNQWSASESRLAGGKLDDGKSER